MVTKPARMYSRITGPAYTRREFMGGVPYPKITTFVQGNQHKEFPIEMRLVAEESCQIRHTALEAARVSVNRKMTNDAGLDNFYLKIVPYPHQVIREHKMATGAGADRISSGMRAAFGRPVGTAARVIHDDVIMIGRTDEAHAHELKEAMKKASIKLPTPCRVLITKGKDIAGALGL